MFENHLFRCHALGKIMTLGRENITPNQLEKLNELLTRTKALTANMIEERDKLIYKRDNPDISTTTKKYLIEVYIKVLYNRSRDIFSKYIEKGLLVEEDSLTTYSLVKRKFYKKNTERLEDEHITGEPDFWEGVGDDIRIGAEIIDDIKSSWDIFTFFDTLSKPINPMYDWQMHGYMKLTTAKKARLVYVLQDTPEHLIESEVWKVKNMMGIIDETNNPQAEAILNELRARLVFKDIPDEQKIREFMIEKDQSKIDAIGPQVISCRQWLDKFHIQLTTGQQLVKLPSDIKPKLIAEQIADTIASIKPEKQLSISIPEAIKYDEFGNKELGWFLTRIGCYIKKKDTTNVVTEYFIIDEITAQRAFKVLQNHMKHSFADGI